jgi:hypothetical protein
VFLILSVFLILWVILVIGYISWYLQTGKSRTNAAEDRDADLEGWRLKRQPIGWPNTTQDLTP